MEVTRQIAEYVATASLEDFPPEALDVATGGIIDCVACMLAGSREPLADILCRFVLTTGGKLSSTVVGKGFKTSAPEAALVNAAAAHALDYGDITPPMKGHPSAVLLPALLALGEEEQSRGQDILLAYMLGFEVACNVGAAMSNEYFDDLGWHPTAPLGTLGAAAAAAHLLRLDIQQTAMAISLAASQAGRLRQNFGTMTKPFHAGLASRAGVTAARLVEAGFTASTDGIEGRFGFLRAFSGGRGYVEEKVLNGLGKTCHLVRSGIDVKKYPCCSSTHLPLDALFLLLQGDTVDPSQIVEVEVRVGFDPPRSLIHDRPKVGMEGKFSMQYCIAAALLDGHVGLGSFADHQVMRFEAQNLIPKITMVRNPEFEGQPSWIEDYNQVRIHLKGGRTLEQGVKRPTEGPLRGVTMEELRSKFRECGSYALTDREIDSALGYLEKMEELDGLVSLVDILRG